MTLWRLERLRLTRTRRWIAPVAIYTMFGLVGPVTERYLGELVRRFGDVQVELPEPTAAGGMAQYVSNSSQLGILAVVAVAAGSLAIDRPPEMGVFLRTRVRSAADLVIPRYVTLVVLVAAAWTLGALAAWYETVVLLGPVSATAVLAGTAYGALYLCFVVALVAAVASFDRGTLTTVLTTVAVLLVLPLLGLLSPIERWVPSELVGALDALAAGTPASQPLTAAATTTVAAIALVALAIHRVGRHEA